MWTGNYQSHPNAGDTERVSRSKAVDDTKSHFGTRLHFQYLDSSWRSLLFPTVNAPQRLTSCIQDKPKKA
jgi:hypothetical protein